MRSCDRPPSYEGLRPASSQASRAARAASRKSGTRCELELRRALWRLGLRYRIDVASLPGRPDIVFSAARLALFCDGDFWHGRELEAREERLAYGHNGPYWIAKIRTNVARDARQTERLEQAGWRVLRFWESEIRRDPAAIALRVAELVRVAWDRRAGHPKNGVEPRQRS